MLREAAELFGRTLVLDSENVTAHHNLAQIYEMLGESEKAERHRALHLRYKPDESALGEAIQAARARYPAANHAAADVVIYDLQRSGASERHQQPQRETRDQP